MKTTERFFQLASAQLTGDLEKEFFSSIRLRNGTYKTTYCERFSDINAELLILLEEGALNVSHTLDIGISSGISTWEFSEGFRRHGYNIHIVATDLMIEAFWVRTMPGCGALMDETGFPLRFDLFGQGMKPWVAVDDYRSGFFILRKAVNVVFTWWANILLSKEDGAGVKPVKLVSPRLLNLPNVDVVKDDIGVYNPSFEGRFDFIRAANILNVGYFSEPQLKDIVVNMMRYLRKPRGALLVMRTHEDGENHGSLFEISNGGTCRVMQRFGAGSEIEHLVLNTDRASNAGSGDK